MFTNSRGLAVMAGDGLSRFLSGQRFNDLVLFKEIGLQDGAQAAAVLTQGCALGSAERCNRFSWRNHT